ncbi:hypothetical protein HZA75_03940 [Candidatus Roizmanbacteria bacterium]|nr:hypothetical protein [Candidatus Roizmanbacteria bacterium]
MSIILLKLEIILILFFIGYGFTEVLLPAKFKERAFWFYPWLATVLISFMGAVLYYGTISMNIGVYFIVAISIFLFVYALLGRHHKNIFSRENMVIFLIIVALSLSLSSSFNFFSLMEKTEFLKKNSIYGTIGLNRSFYQDSDLIGSASLIAFFSVFLKQNINMVANSLTSIYLMLLFPLIYGFSKNSAISSVLSAGAIVTIYFLLKLSNLSLFHLIFFGLTFIFLTLINDYLPFVLTSKNNINPTLFELLMAVTLSSLATIYQLGFKLAFELLIFIGLLNLFSQKRQKILFYLGKIIIFAVIINPIIVGAILWSK